MFNRKNFDKIHKSAFVALNKEQIKCEQMAEILQPFITEEITVHYQMADGYVACWESLGWGSNPLPCNVPVNLFIEKIINDESYYKDE